MKRFLAWFVIVVTALSASGWGQAAPHGPAAQAGGVLHVIVTLRSQPFLAAAEAARAAYAPQLAAAAEALAPVSSPPQRSGQPRTYAEEIAAVRAAIAPDPAEAARQHQAAAALNAVLDQMRQAAFDAARPAVEAAQAPVVAAIQSLG